MALTDPELQRLQQDAVRRVQEMQNRAQHLNNSPQTAPARRTEPDHTAKTAPAEAAVPAPVQSPVPAAQNPVTDIFEALLKDGERTLILVLILLLVEEGADTGLVFALMYLAL